MIEPVKLWRQTFKEGWVCAECEHKKAIVIHPDGWPCDEPPIPQRMCLVTGALDCPEVQRKLLDET